MNFSELKEHAEAIAANEKTQSTLSTTSMQRITMDNSKTAPLLETLREKQESLPDALQSMGLLGPEGIDGKKVHASLCLTKEALDVDRQARNTVNTFLGEGSDLQTRFGICIENKKDAWIIARGSKENEVHYENASFQPAAFVALTACSIVYVPHALSSSLDKDMDWTSATVNKKKLTRQFLAEYEALDTLPTLTLELQAGDCVLTRDGMPFKLVGDNAVIKLISLVQNPKDNNKRSVARKHMRESIEGGIALSATHSVDDFLCASLLHALKLSAPESPLFTVASIDDVEEYVKAKKGGASATISKKEEAPTSPEAQALIREAHSLLERTQALSERVWKKKDEDSTRTHLTKLESGENKSIVRTELKKRLATLDSRIVEAEKHQETVEDTDRRFQALRDEIAALTVPSNSKFEKIRAAIKTLEEQVDKADDVQLSYPKQLSKLEKVEGQLVTLKERIEKKKDSTMKKRTASKSSDDAASMVPQDVKPFSLEDTPAVDMPVEGEYESAIITDAAIAAHKLENVFYLAAEQFQKVADALNQPWFETLLEGMREELTVRQQELLEQMGQDYANPPPVSVDFGLATELMKRMNGVSTYIEKKRAEYEQSLLQQDSDGPFSAPGAKTCRHKRSKEVFNGKCYNCFMDDSAHRIQELEVGERIMVDAVGNESGEEIAYAGNDEKEEAAFEAFYDFYNAMTLLEKKLKKEYLRLDIRNNKEDLARVQELCRELDMAITATEKHLPVKYNARLNKAKATEILERAVDDDFLDEEDADEASISLVASDHESESDVENDSESASYSSDEESSVSSSKKKKKRSRESLDQDERVQAAIAICDAFSEVPVEKERNAAFKNWQRGHYAAARDEARDVLKAEMAYGIRMINKKTKKEFDHDYMFLSVADRDRELQAMEGRSSAFAFEATERNLKKRAREEDE